MFHLTDLMRTSRQRDASESRISVFSLDVSRGARLKRSSSFENTRLGHAFWDRPAQLLLSSYIDGRLAPLKANNAHLRKTKLSK